MLRKSRKNQRRLRYESLEDRRMLALFVVDSVADILVPGTLRSAIADSNASVNTKDEIIFDASLFNSGTPIINLNASLPAMNVPVNLHSPNGPVILRNGGSVQEGIFLRPNLSQGISEDFEIKDLVFEDL